MLYHPHPLTNLKVKFYAKFLFKGLKMDISWTFERI